MRKLLVFIVSLLAIQPINSVYEARNFDSLIGHLPGIEDDALRMHFKLYQGYVTNSNLLLEELSKLGADGKSKSPYYAGLKRILGWEMDGMRLHEFYFENLGKSDLDLNGEFVQAIKDQYGSLEKWQNDFVATGLIRGVGWAVLYQDPVSKKLINMWINEHDTGHLAGGTPILIMDVWEHAYMTQYGTDRAAYIKAFIDNINWGVVNRRFNQVNQPNGNLQIAK